MWLQLHAITLMTSRMALWDYDLGFFDILTDVFNFFDVTTLMTSAQVCQSWSEIARLEWNWRLRMLSCWVDETHHEHFWMTIHNTEGVLTGAFVNRILYRSFGLARVAILDIVVPRGQPEDILQILRDVGYSQQSGRMPGNPICNPKVKWTWTLFNTEAHRVLSWIYTHGLISHRNAHTSKCLKAEPERLCQ